MQMAQTQMMTWQIQCVSLAGKHLLRRSPNPNAANAKPSLIALESARLPIGKKELGADTNITVLVGVYL
jgi:hypothetical protein